MPSQGTAARSRSMDRPSCDTFRLQRGSPRSDSRPRRRKFVRHQARSRLAFPRARRTASYRSVHRSGQPRRACSPPRISLSAGLETVFPVRSDIACSGPSARTSTPTAGEVVRYSVEPAMSVSGTPRACAFTTANRTHDPEIDAVARKGSGDRVPLLITCSSTSSPASAKHPRIQRVQQWRRKIVGHGSRPHVDRRLRNSRRSGRFQCSDGRKRGQA